MLTRLISLLTHVGLMKASRPKKVDIPVHFHPLPRTKPSVKLPLVAASEDRTPSKGKLVQFPKSPRKLTHKSPGAFR